LTPFQQSYFPAGPAADNTASALDALDEEELDGGAWGEAELDMGGEEDDLDAVGGEYEGGDPDDDAEEGWEMEVACPPTSAQRIAFSEGSWL